MPLVFYIASVALVLAGMGCTSTLTEYRCEVAADCGGDLATRCEASGHCSFADATCATGFRFGKGSGSESNNCVREGGPGNPDAGGNGGPVAVISDFAMPCGQTSAEFDGALSTATEGATLVDFAWQLRGPGGEILDEFEGPPDDLVTPKLHRLGGTLLRPLVNATTYEGRMALLADVSLLTGEVLYTPFSIDTFAKGGDLPRDFQLSFALGTTSEATTGQVYVLDSMDSLVDSRFIEIGSGMQPYQFDVTVSDAPFVSLPLRLIFAFGQAGTYWVDNVALVDLSKNAQLIANGSVEESEGLWRFGTLGTSDQEASTQELPEQFQQGAQYTLRLRVTDSDNVQSAYDELQFEVAECFGF